MFLNPIIEKLKSLKLIGMLLALEEQIKTSNINQLSFEERLGLMVDREETNRNNKKFQRRIRSAKLKQQACLEDVDYKTPRGLSKASILSLGECRWIDGHQDLLLTGPTGIGKSYLASALAHRACQRGFSAIYYRASRLFQEIAICKADGRYTKLITQIARTDLLVIDDLGIAPLAADEARDLLEIVEDRHKARSMIITSQLPLDKWFSVIGDATIADAVMDRIVNNSHVIDLDGDSMRKIKSSVAKKDDSKT
jgi:DNA replication protein DnaC